MSLKDYSLGELKDEVERREHEEFSKHWRLCRKHFEEKCLHCGWFNSKLVACVKLNVIDLPNGFSMIQGDPHDFEDCDYFVDCGKTHKVYQ